MIHVENHATVEGNGAENDIVFFINGKNGVQSQSWMQNKGPHCIELYRL